MTLRGEHYPRLFRRGLSQIERTLPLGVSLKMEAGTTSQAVQAASLSWKAPEGCPPARVSVKKYTLLTA